MRVPRLRVRDSLIDDVVAIDRSPFTIGRREANSLRLGNAEVSRDHAEIVLQVESVLLRDRQSKYGTFVNGEQIRECELHAGDEIRLGRSGGALLVFLDDRDSTSLTPSATGPRDALRQVAGLLQQLRGLGPNRVLQQVLTLILDTALEVSRAERGFIMLASGDGALEFRLGRNRSRETLSDLTFATSRKIPDEVFLTGKPQALSDLQVDGDHGRTAQIGIRSVACLPLRTVQFLESAEPCAEGCQLGVLYLDSQTKSALLSEETLSSLEAVAEEASFAIEQARLYRQQADNAKMEQEMRFAAEMQRSLLPPPKACRPYLEAVAATVPCRAIGGDFYDYLREDAATQGFSFTLGDVSGKGAPAALMSAMMLGMIQAEARVGRAEHPADIVSRLNGALCDRGLEARFVTLMLGVIAPDGTLTYCNAGHNPPLIFSRDGVRRLKAGGPVLGLLPLAEWEGSTEQLAPGDALVIFSDGISDALSVEGEEFGETRILDAVGAADGDSGALVERIRKAVTDFTLGAPQSDDITVMVVRYLGC